MKVYSVMYRVRRGPWTLGGVSEDEGAARLWFGGHGARRGVSHVTLCVHEGGVAVILEASGEHTGCGTVVARQAKRGTRLG